MATFIKLDDTAAMVLVAGGAVIALFVVFPEASMAFVEGVIQAVMGAVP